MCVRGATPPTPARRRKSRSSSRRWGRRRMVRRRRRARARRPVQEDGRPRPSRPSAGGLCAGERRVLDRWGIAAARQSGTAVTARASSTRSAVVCAGQILAPVSSGETASGVRRRSSESQDLSMTVPTRRSRAEQPRYRAPGHRTMDRSRHPPQKVSPIVRTGTFVGRARSKSGLRVGDASLHGPGGGGR